MKLKLIVGITGASGSIYAKVLMKKMVQLKDQLQDPVLICSKNAKDVWNHELPGDSLDQFDIKRYDPFDFFSPVASGSAGYRAMIIIPCSMGTLGRIAHGFSDDLMTRAADVMMKEGRKLILVPRETPVHSIHLENMLKLSRIGVTICPASPSYYSHPKNPEELAATVVDRCIDLLGLKQESYRWGG